MLLEALDRRMLLSVSFSFNIIDPNDSFREIRPQLQRLLEAAGAEFASYMEVPEFDVTLEYDVAFSPEQPPSTFSFFTFFPTPILAAGAAKSAQFVGVDDTPTTLRPFVTGADIYQLGTITELLTGVDPNGAKADAGITIFAPNLRHFFFEPDVHRRTAPIPEGQVDGYTAILHEIAHTLGFASARTGGGDPGSAIYTYDTHVDPFGFQFGNGSVIFDFDTGQFVVDPASDNAVKVYGAKVPLQFGNPSELGQGRPTDFFLANFDIPFKRLQYDQRLFDDLGTDLMGGYPAPGERRGISKLDIAILKDVGLPVRLNIDAAPQGILTIDGTSMPDVINLSFNNGTVIVRVNNAATVYTPEQASGITAIVINGLGGNDYITITGNSSSVAIDGGAGNDTLFGGLKGDFIHGGEGNDLIAGGRGNDFLRGGGGNDTIYGQGGSDRILGDSGNDHLDGGLQTDRIFGGSGHDTLVGGTEDDFLYGQAGNDVLAGAGGKDRMDGGPGADWFYGGAGNDVVDYSARTDGIGIIASMDGSPNDGAPGEFDNIVDVENILGTPFDDRIVGSDGPNLLIGGGGNDTIDGSGGSDTLVGDTGADVLIGSGGHDSLEGGSGNDRLIGGTGRDFLFGGDGDDQLFSDDGEIDTLDGGLGNDSATADSFDILDNIPNPTLLSLGTPVSFPSTAKDDDQEDRLRAAGLII